MTPNAELERRLIELGGAVEQPGGLWHIAKTDKATYCGKDSATWPRVQHALERQGIWCGLCLIEATGIQPADTHNQGSKRWKR